MIPVKIARPTASRTVCIDLHVDEHRHGHSDTDLPAPKRFSGTSTMIGPAHQVNVYMYRKK